MQTSIETLLERGRVHSEWHPILEQALTTVDPAYLDSLLDDPHWLPGPDRLLAAFQRDLAGLRYLLIGESPYPRAQSANGIAFYDAAVGELWSESGLSKAVNRATSLRNIIKAALLAEQRLAKNDQGKLTQASIAELNKCGMIRSLPELFDNLQCAGFLMLNATPVLHPERKPAREAIYWREFLAQLLTLLAPQSGQRIRLLLWGKIAELVESIAACEHYDKLVCEHPYNISFIDNPAMQDLFAELQLLRSPTNNQPD